MNTAFFGLQAHVTKALYYVRLQSIIKLTRSGPVVRIYLCEIDLAINYRQSFDLES